MTHSGIQGASFAASPAMRMDRSGSLGSSGFWSALAGSAEAGREDGLVGPAKAWPEPIQTALFWPDQGETS